MIKAAEVGSEGLIIHIEEAVGKFDVPVRDLLLPTLAVQVA